VAVAVALLVQGVSVAQAVPVTARPQAQITAAVVERVQA
jgi:hypothetical protein